MNLRRQPKQEFARGLFFRLAPGTFAFGQVMVDRKLEVGAQSREDVVRLIGSPSAVATFNPNIWYYISETQEYWAYTKPKVSSQKVIQVTFNESGRIEAIKNYDLKDAQDIQMVRRITPTSGKELTILEQVLGNVGRCTGPKQQGGTNPGAPTSGSGI